MTDQYAHEPGGKKPGVGMPHEAEGEEHVVAGIGVSPGIAFGPVYRYARDAFDDVEERALDPAEVADELRRFEQAVSKAGRDLRKIASVAREKLGEGSAEIFEAQALMLRDEQLYDAVVERIRRDHINADYAVQAVMSKHRQLLKASDSEYLSERANDMLDLQHRIIRHLRRGKILSHVDDKTIVVAENITAADIVLFSRRHILGVATNFGGATSHVSIMARALGVPAIVGTHGITEEVDSGDHVVLDALNGQVIVNPSSETRERYRVRQERYARLVQEHKQLVPLPSETLDGHEIRLAGNLEFKDEVDLLAKYGAHGIGLFRTEILVLMQRRILLSEEEQFETYRDIAASVAPEVTTFRLLDLGGDKMLPLGHREHNPFLGWRGLRILLDRPELLEPQLRAILRASHYGPSRILVPMVTHMQEVRKFRKIFEATKADLRSEGIPFDEEVPLGIMVEVPSVALRAELFAREVDFFSIGTNDLTQYVMAVDRGNDLVADRYEELNPAVLELIGQTVEGARAVGIPVSVCGEMASRPDATPLLLGLGIDELSAAPVFLPEVKRVIRAIKMDEAQELAQKALAAEDTDEVHALVDEWLYTHACGMIRVMQAGDGEGGEAVPDADVALRPSVDVRSRT